MDMVRMKDAVVEAMLPHAAFDGWSVAGLRAAARDLDLDWDQLSQLFPKGSVDVIAHFVDYADRAMVSDFAESGFASAGVGVQVFQAVRLRLERWTAHREAIRRAASVLSLPQNLPLALRLTWGTADAVWLALGDRSHDFSWDTKRATLSAIYSATMLYWLDDTSEDSADSWAFLRRRLDELRNIPKLRQRVQERMTGSKLGGMAARFKASAR